MFVLPAPITEDVVDMPVSIFREPIYRGANSRSESALRKMSITDALRVFIGIDLVEDHLTSNDIISQFWRWGTPLASHAYESATYLPMSNKPDDRMFGYQHGFGPLSQRPGRNGPGAELTYSAMRPFPQEIAPVRAFA
jgi:hypothetical protein